MEISFFAHAPPCPHVRCIFHTSPVGKCPDPMLTGGGPNSVDPSPMLEARQHLVARNQPVRRLAPASQPASLSFSPSFAGFRAGMRHQNAHQQHTHKQRNKSQKGKRLSNLAKTPAGRADAKDKRREGPAVLRLQSGRGGEKCVCLRCAAALRLDAQPRPVPWDPTRRERPGTCQERGEMCLPTGPGPARRARPRRCTTARPHVVRRLPLAWLSDGRRKRGGGLKRAKGDGTRQTDTSAPCDTCCPRYRLPPSLRGRPSGGRKKKGLNRPAGPQDAPSSPPSPARDGHPWASLRRRRGSCDRWVLGRSHGRDTNVAVLPSHCECMLLGKT